VSPDNNVLVPEEWSGINKETIAGNKA